MHLINWPKVTSVKPVNSQNVRLSVNNNKGNKILIQKTLNIKFKQN